MSFSDLFITLNSYGIIKNEFRAEITDRKLLTFKQILFLAIKKAKHPSFATTF